MLAGASVSLLGCGGGSDDTTGAPSPAPPGGYDRSTVQLVWDNHFSAFAGFDVPKIMKDYDETSMIATFNDHCFNNQTDNSGYKTYAGVTEIKAFFTALFQQLDSNLTNVNYIGPNGGASAIAEGDGGPIVKEATTGGDYNGNVFLTWRTTAELQKTISLATDSFSFKKKDGGYFVDYQTIVTTEEDTACAEAPGQLPTTGSEAIYAAWANHLDGFGSKNLDTIMKDYDANSEIEVYDNTDNTLKTYDTEAEIKDFFDGLFQAITAGAVDGDEGVGIGLLEVDPMHNSVFLAWKSKSHPKATDTFIFDGNNPAKIARQNIVVSTKSPAAQRIVV